jgi:hypothetical protein
MLQKIATRVFITASIAFGIIGIVMILIAPDNDNDRTALDKFLVRLLFITVFIILPSFAVSVAAKYLSDKERS